MRTTTTATTKKQIAFYPNQYDFVLAPEHFLAFVAGIGSGKSLAGSGRALAASQGYVGGAKVLQTPNLGMITAPTYPMLRDATLRAFMDLAGSAVADFNKSEMTATMVNGSEVLFRSADDPDRLRGPNLSWWFGDEAALCVSDVWRVGIGRLRQFGRAGYAWITTTPKGRNWIYQEFVQRQRRNYRVLKGSTFDNIFLDAEFVAGLKEAYAGDFALQELYGEFVAFEGLIYPEFDPRVHRYTTLVDTSRFKRIVAAQDWGFTNPGVLLIGGEDGDGRLHVFHEEYQRQRRIEEWASAAKQLYDTYRFDTVYCDPSEPDYIDAYRAAGVPAVQANNSVNPGIQAVRQRLVVRGDGNPRLFVHSSAANTLAEFEQYQWAEHRGEGYKDMPLKANDHAMDTLRYMCMGLEVEPVTITAGAKKVA